MATGIPVVRCLAMYTIAEITKRIAMITKADNHGNWTPWKLVEKDTGKVAF